jgi:hypothetical protein
MAMKLIDKHELRFKGGIFWLNNEAVVTGTEHLWDMLCDEWQRANYILGQPEPAPAKSIAGYERKRGQNKFMREEPETPVLNRDAKHAQNIIAELDLIEKTKAFNQLVDKYQALYEFAANHEVPVFDGECGTVFQMDMAEIGNPLNVDVVMLDHVLETIVEAMGEADLFGDYPRIWDCDGDGPAQNPDIATVSIREMIEGGCQ